ncbi:23S rRNA (guanosine(2251)-2'-O)-methyltransferase RlmB, partial [Candidatus Riflebacteria bacterium]
KKSEFREISLLAEKKRIASVCVDKQTLYKLSGSRQHQGMVGEVSDYLYNSNDQLSLAVQNNNKIILLFLDGLQDPGNFGSIIRTAVAFGITHLVISKNRCCPVTGGVFKSSVGTIEKVNIYRVSNLATTARVLKKMGVWFYGASPITDKTLAQQDFILPCALVIGAEGHGIGRSMEKILDFNFFISMQNEVESLNASQVFAIIAYSLQEKLEL